MADKEDSNGEGSSLTLDDLDASTADDTGRLLFLNTRLCSLREKSYLIAT